MADDDKDIKSAAHALFDAHTSGKPCSPVRETLGIGNIDAAYATQQHNTERWLKQGRVLSGRKIGLTSKVVQTQLGVDQPDYGALFSDMDVPDDVAIPVGKVLQPKVEAEIAFRLNQDLETEFLTVADILSSVEYAVAAIEVVGSRVANWDISIVDTIADNASSGLYVIGHEPKQIGEFDPRLCGMVMECRSEPVSTGAGTACLGSPINATLWLAQTMARVGTPLRKGDLVLSGALGPMVPANPGDVFEAKINGLGSVRAAFAAE
ncbi:2-keto-4-pentenoate hydratase [Phaeobacter sp. 11ANDIMAR09]|uniref:2-keto-4-pentenoate hydratase n=1 Tax=Phaeobacter sp. 11ANDIMAR09 TaxID=1225647 RepID=UPI0006C858C2|nr:fumarylacetoacetate hydrolase family protein [Phaeobacter sp. 11ANDIMAR09]KPD11060.1 2-keto-4-pentenoate hydratase [Phaeobacter sp. 11ANDIMAR09]